MVKTLTIIAAAIRQNGVNYILLPPKRHHDIIAWMIEQGEKPPISGEQGFITNTMKFVNRKEGARIAIAAGQIVPRDGKVLKNGLNTPPNLYSEDMW